jgi:4-cresol dehydrogenase (hydroxylating)
VKSLAIWRQRGRSGAGPLLSVARSVFEQAARAWIQIVGAEHVIGDRPILREAETATFATTQRIPLIVRPADVREVQACVAVANRYGVPLYPISSGKNWGYGSKVPPRDGSVLLDLGRLNRILEFDEDLAYVTVEAGVTQQQLYDFLRARGSRLWMDATGSSPSCTLVGNVMERGFGHTPYGDHFAHVCGLQVVLPKGECIQTGSARFRNAATGARSATGAVYRWGLGPVLDGLFTQSNFGIVVGMSVWLMPAPERFEAFFFRCGDEHALGPVIDALRPLRLNGTLRSAIHIGNDYKVLNGIQQYPWAETGGKTPLSPEDMTGFRARLRMGRWNGSGGLYGTKAQVAEAKRLLREHLRGKVAAIQFLNDRTFVLARRFARVYRRFTGLDLTATLALVRPVYGLMQGVPTPQPLASAYWRKRTPPPPPESMNPDVDGCGLLWCAPVCPLQGDHAERLAKLATDTLLAHGFEPMLSLTLITERALTCIISISYDRAVPGEDERAMRCYRELMAELTAAGYHSYRVGIQASDEIHEESASETSYATLLRTLKDALDPNGVVAPGRYGISSRH